MNLIILGPAGSGKSTLTKNFLDYLINNGYDAKAVNLDPASKPNYRVERDIRDYVKSEEIMERFNLGINGALLKSAEIAMDYIEELIVEGEYVLYDTPGQMELFLYTDFGTNFISQLDNFKACIFIVDAKTALKAENYISAIAQSVVISLRLSIPTLTVFNKIDIARIRKIEEVKKEIESGGVLNELMESLFKFIEYSSIFYRIIGISAKKCMGFDDLFGAIHELFCSCGDLS